MTQSNQPPASDVTRRHFVRASSATLGVAAMSSPALGWIQGSDTIKVGLIGCGGRGTGAKAAASSSTDDDKYPNLSLLGISDEKLVEYLHQPRPPSPTLKDFSRYGDDDPFREGLE